ncbi:MAG: hypothetical protein A4E26_00463 [Methanobacterium sp. PtaU1.Bin097]|jgi:hypothetical protein|nr:MAG: hypothetical protein A4E26_00463 [Methanobacterium sp. PtaU1.Bin097]
MASLETSVFVSVLIALILIFVDYLILPTLLVTVLPIVVFTGFIASAMAGSEGNNYRVGGIAGGVLAVLFFLVKFFTPPTLTFNLYGLDFNVFLMFEGFIYLILGFVISLAIFMLLGAFGGMIAQELFGPDEKERDKQGNSKPLRN